MTAETSFDALDPQQMRQALHALQAELARKDEIIERQVREAAFKQATIDKLTHEMAVLKRLKFAANRLHGGGRLCASQSCPVHHG